MSKKKPLKIETKPKIRKVSPKELAAALKKKRIKELREEEAVSRASEQADRIAWECGQGNIPACCICSEDFSERRRVIQCYACAGIGHYDEFHDSWRNNNSRCPCCRARTAVRVGDNPSVLQYYVHRHAINGRPMTRTEDGEWIYLD